MGAFALAQSHEPVAVPRVARLAPEAEVDAGGLAHGREALDDHGRFGLAEFGGEVGPLVDPDAGRRGVQVEGLPGRREGVWGGRVRGLVERDGPLELLLADVAPWADVVGGYGDVEVCHCLFFSRR